MSDLIDTLWSQFAVETEEHIEAIELGLVEAEQNGASPELISGLFRAFHSLKGLANAMDLLGMGRVAHLSEDIMGLARDGGVALSPQIVSVLLDALDVIKSLQEQGVAERSNTDPPPEILTRLSELFNLLKGGGTPQESVAAPAVTPSAELPPSGSVQAAPVEAPTPLHADPDMLEFFMELVQENIPVLSRMLEPVCTSDEQGEVGQCLLYLDDAGEALGRLEHAARVMEFFNLVETLGRVRAALPTVCPVPEEQQKQLTDCIRDLHDQISHIERSSGGKDVGSSQLFQVIKDAMHDNLDRLFQSIMVDLDALEGAGESGDDLLLAESLHTNLATASSHLAFFLPSVNCNILLMLEDVFGRAARGELHIFTEIIEITRDLVKNVSSNYRSCSQAKACLRVQNEGAENFRAATIQRIHDYIWAYESGSGTNNPVEAFRRFMAGLKIDPELVKILSPENVRDLMRSIEKGEHIYEVLAHLESNEQVASGFLVWVENSGSRVVTNRSVFIDDLSWYEMLMVSPLSRSELEQQLRAIDPGNNYLKMKAASDGMPGEAEVLRKIAEPPARQPQTAAAAGGNVIRVQGEMLDGFMNQIGEMVLARSRLNHILHDERLTSLLARLRRQGALSPQEAAGILDILEEHRRNLVETDTLIHSTLGRLQESAMGLRVVPVEMVFKRLPRVVRDLSQNQGKRIRLEMGGQEVKIDKAMVDILVDPLLHMVRNSIDHGIETPDVRKAQGKPLEAVIKVSARQQGNSIMIEISDDGKGIDAERVLQKAVERGLVREEDKGDLSRQEIFRFIFQPGFSTAAAVTETSGRGVGMDVVMTNVMRLGGSITVESEAGRGADFQLQMPLSAAVQEVLMVEAAGQTLALPGRYVSEVLEIGAEEVQSLRGERAILLRGMFLPLHPLAGLLGFAPREKTDSGLVCLVVFTNGRQMVGIEVDRVLRRQELFTKDIQEAVAALPGVGGASILGNGRVVLIMDGEELLKLSKLARR